AGGSRWSAAVPRVKGVGFLHRPRALRRRRLHRGLGTMAGTQRVGIIGAGLMGHGIAQVFAQQGHAVGVYYPNDAAPESLRDRTAANLRYLDQDVSAAERVMPTSSIIDAVRKADVVIEAALEKLELKQDIFAELESVAPRHALLASNTSVIPIAKIAARVK